MKSEVKAYELADLDGERLEEARHGRLDLVGDELSELLGHVLQVLGHALVVDLHRVLHAFDNTFNILYCTTNST